MDNFYTEDYNAFGEISWSVEDLENELDCNDFPVTEKNIDILYRACNTRAFLEHITQAGFDFINNIIQAEQDNLDQFE